jgi:hypothetical protein
MADSTYRFHRLESHMNQSQAHQERAEAFMADSTYQFHRLESHMNQSIAHQESAEEFKSNTSMRLDRLEAHWTMNLGDRLVSNPLTYLCVATLVSAIKSGVAYPASIIPEGLFIVGAVSTQELGWVIFSPSIPQVLESTIKGVLWTMSAGISYKMWEHKDILAPGLTTARLTGGAAVLAAIAAMYSNVPKLWGEFMELLGVN